MAIKDRMSGNEAVAYAMKQINPDVMGGFSHHAFHGDSAVFFEVYR